MSGEFGKFLTSAIINYLHTILEMNERVSGNDSFGQFEMKGVKGSCHGDNCRLNCLSDWVSARSCKLQASQCGVAITICPKLGKYIIRPRQPPHRSVSPCCLIESCTYGSSIIPHMQQDLFPFSTLTLTRCGFGFNSKDWDLLISEVCVYSERFLEGLKCFFFFFKTLTSVLPPEYNFLFNEVFKSFYGRWVVWFDLWLRLCEIAFC